MVKSRVLLQRFLKEKERAYNHFRRGFSKLLGGEYDPVLPLQVVIDVCVERLSIQVDQYLDRRNFLCLTPDERLAFSQKSHNEPEEIQLLLDRERERLKEALTYDFDEFVNSRFYARRELESQCSPIV